VCREQRDEVAAFPWADADTRIDGRLALWRACFPHARAANVRMRSDLVSADFALLAGIHTLIMVGCSQPTITDAAIVHLRGIRTLVMDDCSQATITGATLSSHCELKRRQ
jgi:hypothetical protein